MKKIVAFIAVLIYITCTGTVWGQLVLNSSDQTNLIQNSNFDRFSGSQISVTGWSGTNFWNVDNCAEQWNRNFDFYQDIASLPNGLYKVSVQGFYRDGNTGGANGKAQNAILYANKMEVPLMNILEEKIDSMSGAVKVNGAWIPNTMSTANVAFSAGLYANNCVFVNVTDGNLRIGIKKEVALGSDWACFDNFKLTYVGTINNAYTGEGKFYLQNVETSEYLQGGGMDGLQTMLGNGIEFELVKKCEGIYNIRNVGINKEGKDYLCDEGRLDHQPVDFIITDAGGGVYNIATTAQHCLKDDKYSPNGVINRLLTPMQDNIAEGERSKDLNDFAFNEWSQAAPGGYTVQAWGETDGIKPQYSSNTEYGEGALIYGTSTVNWKSYADLSGYTSMTIKGKQGSRVRILFNRIVDEGENVEEAIEIGASGSYTIDLSGYGFVHLNAIKVAWGGTATIESITLNKLPAKTADLGNIQFALWSQATPGGTRTTVSPQNFYSHIGEIVNAEGLVFGDAGVWPLSYADLTGYKYMMIKAATPGAVFRVLLNREGTNDSESSKGNFVEKEVTIGADGYGILDLSEYSYVHLNAIKLKSGSASTLVESITLSRGQDVVAFAANANTWDGKSQWRFKTESERISELTNAGASRTNPKDATFLIKNASLTEIDNNPNSAEGSTHWTWVSHWYYIQRDETTHTDGAGGVLNLGGSGSGASSCDVYQEVKGIPNGLYEVSMQGCYRSIGNPQFYANSISVGLDEAGGEFPSCNHPAGCSCRKIASVQTYGTNNYKKTLRVIVEDGTLRIGVRGDKIADVSMLIFDNFTLSYMGEATVTTYYMRNVATGDFVRAGGHYEAQAIRDDWGLALDFITFGRNTNLYYIDSRISNGGANQYLGTNGFLDSPETEFTLENLGNSRYAIRTTDGKYLATADGDNYVNFDRGVQSGDTYAQWELLTREQLIEELKNSGASDSNPKDATFLIEGSNLGRHDLRNNSNNWTGIDFNTGEFGGVESSDWNSSDNFANFVIEKYDKNSFDTYQTISGLPAGVYELTVQGYYRSGNTAIAAGKTNDGTDILRPFLYVKQEGKLIGQAPLQSIFDGGVGNKTDGFSTSANGEWLPNSLIDAAKTFRDGHYMPSGEYNKVRFVVPSDGATVQIGIKKNIHYTNDWTAFDNFRLTYLGSPQNGETQTVYTTEIGEILGTYYLKNAQTGTYLTAGGTDGVSAVLGDQMHQHSVYNNEAKYQKGVRETDFTFVAVGADKFVIETGIGEGYLTYDNGVKLNGKPEPSKAFLTLRKNDNGNYYISYGSDLFLRYSDNYGFGWGTSQSTTPENNFQWIFQTKEELLAEFPNATESNPIDATFLLRGTAFHKDDSRNSAWTGKPVVGGAESNYVGSASGRTYNISQTLTDLPAGVYEFTLQGYHTNENGINEQARYYVSTDVHQRTLITKNTSGATTFINAKNYAIPGDAEKNWELDFQNGTGGVPIPNANTDYNVTISEAIDNSIGKITINGTSITDYFGLQTGTNWLQRHTSKGVKGLFQ